MRTPTLDTARLPQGPYSPPHLCANGPPLVKGRDGNPFVSHLLRACHPWAGDREKERASPGPPPAAALTAGQPGAKAFSVDPRSPQSQEVGQPLTQNSLQPHNLCSHQTRPRDPQIKPVWREPGMALCQRLRNNAWGPPCSPLESQNHSCQQHPPPQLCAAALAPMG